MTYFKQSAALAAAAAEAAGGPTGPTGPVGAAPPPSGDTAPANQTANAGGAK